MDSSNVRQHDDWLDAEAGGREHLAEQAFARLMAELPDDEPPARFIEQVTADAWGRRRRRQWVARAARVAAAVLVAAAASAAVYGFSLLLAGAAGGVLVAAAEGLVWVAGAMGEGLRWWEIAGRVSVALGDQVTAPGTTAVLAGAEVLGAMAIYAFQRVLRDTQPDSQKVEI